MNVGKPNNDITTLYDANNDATNVVASSISAQFTHAPIQIEHSFCRLVLTSRPFLLGGNVLAFRTSSFRLELFPQQLRQRRCQGTWPITRIPHVKFASNPIQLCSGASFTCNTPLLGLFRECLCLIPSSPASSVSPQQLAQRHWRMHECLHRGNREQSDPHPRAHHTPSPPTIRRSPSARVMKHTSIFRVRGFIPCTGDVTYIRVMNVTIVQDFAENAQLLNTLSEE